MVNFTFDSKELAVSCDNSPTLVHELTEDSLFNGAVVCQQHAKGYRFSVDAVLAAHFSPPRRGDTIVDLGSGCGIISLILLYRWRERIEKLIALELQPQLCLLIKKNFAINGLSDKAECRQGDVKNILETLRPESCSLLFCNPPYYPPSSGRKCSNQESRIARHQLEASIYEFAKAAAAVVKNGGVTVFVYPAERINELMNALGQAKLTIKQLQVVYSYPDHDDAGRLVLVRCVKNGGEGCQVLQPMFIYNARNGPYTAEMEALYAPGQK